MGATGKADDPLFQRTKPAPETKRSTVLVWQFFLLPLLIVVAALAVFLLFGAFAGSESSPSTVSSCAAVAVTALLSCSVAFD